MNKKPDAPPGTVQLPRDPRQLWRQVLIGAAYLVVFLILDLISRKFQELRGIVAWYPPAGLTYTLLFVFGRKFLPAVTIALFASSVFVYQMPQPIYLLLLWAIIISLIYIGAAAFLHYKIHFDWHLRKLRDVSWFVGTVVVVSALLAVLSVSSSALSSNMARNEVFRSIFNWWIGETVGVLTMTPFLLIFVMPAIKRFLEGQPIVPPARWTFQRPAISTLGQVASIVLTLYWVFGAPVLNEYQPLYLISLPLIWIALQRGFKGISAAILALNSGVVLALWVFKFDVARLGELELLMIINSIVGLLMGAAVTERIQAEKRLNDSELRFRALIENSSDAIALVNTEGKIIYRSPAAYFLLGLDPGDPRDNSMLGAIHPDDAKDAEKRYVQFIKAPGHSIPFKYRIRHKDGSWRWVEGTGINLLAEPGINAIVTNYRDVTEQRRSEAERQALLDIMKGMAATGSLDELLDLIRQSIGKVIYADNFFVVFHNNSSGLFEEVFAVDQFDPPMPPSKLDKSIISYVFRSGESLLLTDSKFEELKEAGEVELVGTKPKIWMGAPLKTPTETIGVMAVQNYEDADCYTERDKEFLSSVSAQVAVVIEGKRVVEELQKSEKRFRALVENSLEEISLINSDGNLTWESPTTRRPLGYPPNSFVGGTLIDIIHPDEREEATQLLGQIMETPGSIKEANFRLRHKDGSWRWMEAVITNLLEEPAVQSVVINYRDITERKVKEEEIQFRTEELGSLYQLSRDLADANDLERVITIVNRHAVESVHTTFASVALLEGKVLVPQSVHPLRNIEHEFMLGDRQPIITLPNCQRVLDQNEPVILQNRDVDADSVEHAFLLLDNAQTVCLVPLRVGDPLHRLNQAIGLLILGEEREEKREPFTPEKIRLARSIGDQAAAAIRRLLLREEAEIRLQHLAAMSEIDRTIASNFDLRVSLHIILKHVTEQLRVDAANVLVFNKKTQTLEFAAGSGFRSAAVEGIRQPHGEGQAGRALVERKIIIIPDIASSGVVFAYPEFVKEENAAAYFAVPLITKGQVMGVLEIYHRSPLDPNEEWIDFLKTLSGQAAIAIDNVHMFESLQRSADELELAYDATIEGWSHALDLRDKETEGHTQRVTEMTMKLARSFGLSEAELINVRWGALLHDIGKMGVPDNILLKPGALTNDEWVVMKRHPALAYELLLPIRHLHGALDIPYCHHEWWNGSGYPRGLKGEEIPLAARIFAVVDVWDALISDRPYRQAWSKEKSRDHIQSEAGTHFDPEVVNHIFHRRARINKTARTPAKI